MQRPASSIVTEVETSHGSPVSSHSHYFPHNFHPLTSLIHRSFFPGNAGNIDYDRLCTGRDELPHTSYQLETDVGSIVGVHEYVKESSDSNVVIILAHGNTRPTRCMKDLISSLLECDVKAVVGRDFVGYDSSSQVPFSNGALEVAAHANDVTFINHITGKYPDSHFILCGRSIGTFFWAGQLHHPRVIGAIGIVPFTSPISVIQNMLDTKTPACLRHSILGFTDFSRFAGALAAATFPRGCTSPKLQEFTTKGFEMNDCDPEVKGKQVVLFPGRDDELIPQTSVQDLKSKLEAAECRVEVNWTEGGHRALPSSLQLQEAVELIKIVARPR